MSSFSESFIYSCKQGGGATVLREGCDTVTRETCDHYSLNINILGKTAVLHFPLTLFCGWGHAKLSLPIIGHSCTCLFSSAAGAVPDSACRLFDTAVSNMSAVLMSRSHRLLILHSPQKNIMGILIGITLNLRFL
jgi:hypothetical protein